MPRSLMGWTHHYWGCRTPMFLNRKLLSYAKQKEWQRKIQSSTENWSTVSKPAFFGGKNGWKEENRWCGLERKTRTTDGKRCSQKPCSWVIFFIVAQISLNGRKAHSQIFETLSKKPIELYNGIWSVYDVIACTSRGRGRRAHCLGEWTGCCRKYSTNLRKSWVMTDHKEGF